VSCAAWNPDQQTLRFMVNGNTASGFLWSARFGLREVQPTPCPLAYDPVRRRTVAFGPSLVELDDFGVVATDSLSVSATGGLPGSLGAAELSFKLGGRGQDDAGAPSNGARLAVAPLGVEQVTAAAPEAPQPYTLRFDVADAGATGALTLQLSSLGINGTSSAQVGVSEVKVIYRLRR
jgi:hypothetical protein